MNAQELIEEAFATILAAMKALPPGHTKAAFEDLGDAAHSLERARFAVIAIEHKGHMPV